MINYIKSQYSSSNLYEGIIKTLSNRGVLKENISIKEVSMFDEFHVRGRQVSMELLDCLQLNKDSKVLDIGCGLGGTCRMIANRFNSHVVGIDITEEYVRSGNLLSKLVLLDENTEFVHGDALNLPFESESFDLVISQHTQMNIEDKEQFYSEIYRILKPNGFFLYYDVFKIDDGNLCYPLPWADISSCSFLMSINELRGNLEKMDFKKIEETDQTDKGIRFLSTFLEKVRNNESLLIGQKLLMGVNTKDKLSNIYNGLKENKILLQSGIWKK